MTSHATEAERLFEEWWCGYSNGGSSGDGKYTASKEAWLAAFTQGAVQERVLAADLAASANVPNESCEYELVLRQAIAQAIRQRGEPG